MGALIVIFCIIFAFLFYLGEKNDEIWKDETLKDETLKELFPRSNTINIKFCLIMGYFMFAGAMVLEVKYNGKIPMIFLAMLLEDWIFVLLLIWNHRDSKENMKYALIYGKFDFMDILND